MYFSFWMKSPSVLVILVMFFSLKRWVEMPKRLRRQRPEPGISAEALFGGWRFWVSWVYSWFFMILHGWRWVSWVALSIWARGPSWNGLFSSWNGETFGVWESMGILSFRSDRPASLHRSFSFWDFPALLQLHVGTRGMVGWDVLSWSKRPNLMPQRWNSWPWEGLKMLRILRYLAELLHLEQSQAQHGVDFA